jgi:polysulfide reductase chain C
MVIFLVLGAIQISPTLGLADMLSWNPNGLFLKILMIILSFFVITHGFMTMNVMTSIPLWNSSILPVLSLASGIWLGTQLAMGLAFSEQGLIISLEPVARWSLFVYAFLIIFYLWNASHATAAAKESLKIILTGQLAVYFYTGVVLIGILVPIIITVTHWVNGLDSGSGVIYLRILFAIVGDATLRYIISKSGRYAPLVYSNVVHRLPELKRQA